jgi:hypothetical protein
VNLGVKFLAAHTTNVAEFVELYRSFTIKQLSSLCETHNIWPGKTKSFLESLLKHNCDPGCTGYSTVLLFAVIRRVREGVVERRTIESVRREETLRRDRFEMNKTLKASSASTSVTHPILRRDAAEKAANDARQAFPFVADLSHQKRIAQEWQTEMEPHRWIPRPCAVCGRRTVTGMLTFCNPLHYDLAVAPNPALPVETLTKTYDLDAYDGAILCASALQDPTQKAPFEMCVYCKTAMDRHQQPLDSLANFQYYARDELPPEVKSAFRDATTYDKMMCAHSRCTRITHLFSDKDGRERPDSVRSTSQRYSKGNVAIFTQDVASLRAVLQPPREDIHEVMCALSIVLHLAGNISARSLRFRHHRHVHFCPVLRTCLKREYNKSPPPLNLSRGSHRTASNYSERKGGVALNSKQEFFSKTCKVVFVLSFIL